MNCTLFITQNSCSDFDISYHKLKKAISFLYEQVLFMCDHGFNVKVCGDIYETWIWRGHSLYELWQDCELDNDLKGMLNNILYERVDTVSDKSKDIKYGDDETSSYGLLTTSSSSMVDVSFQVYPERLSYRYIIEYIDRLTLSSDDFLDACRHIMDNVYLIDTCNTSIKPIYKDFKHTILRHLDVLNVHLATERHNGLRRDQLLKKVSQMAHLPEDATLEGDAKRKDDLTFSFSTPNGQKCSVCCEPHMKLCRSDQYPGDGEYYFHRIYFHEGQKNVCDGKIVVGHIGKHL